MKSTIALRPGERRGSSLSQWQTRTPELLMVYGVRWGRGFREELVGYVYAFKGGNWFGRKTSIIR